MTHPFTLDYMREGEMPSTHQDLDDAKLKGREKSSFDSESHIEQRSSTSISDTSPVTDGFQMDALAGESVDDLEKIERSIGTSSFGMTMMVMRNRMKVFAQEVSIVGLSYLLKPSSHKIGSIVRKIIWMMLLLFGTGFMAFQIYDHISYYLEFPTTVSYKVAYNRSLRFPTVTICSEFLLSSKAFQSSGPQFRELTSVKLPPAFEIGLSDDPQRLNFSQHDLDWAFVFGYMLMRMDDALLECSFGNRPCNSNDAFETVASEMGNCFSFNPAASNYYYYVTTQPGANYGLRLVLWVNQSDCLVALSPGVGFRVALHDAKDLPMMTSIGFRVGTGVSTSISFSLRNVSMLPAPYGGCRQTDNYTYMRCMTQCAEIYVFSRCKCRTQAMTYRAIMREKLCSLQDMYSCVPGASRLWISSGASRKCECPLHCHQITYPYSISSSQLSQHFLNHTSQRSQFKGRNLTMSKLSKELVYLDIFYSQLSYVDIQTYPAYDFLTLVCDIGGALGLILGCSILTIVELIQFFIQLLSDIGIIARFAKMQRR